MPVGQGAVLSEKYRIDGVIGEGGMGIVLRARHLELDQEVAVKVLLPEHAGNPEVVARFLREARAAASITSEHAARIADVGRTVDGLPYMVMELLVGCDLEQELSRRGPLPLAEAASYLLQACEAVAEAHAAGIVHRDLKPANLYLARIKDTRVVVKVLDFGISKVEGAPQSLTRAGTMMGTPHYMAPEQITGASTADSRSDVWSLGVTFYESVTGARPFDGETLPELVAKILREDPLPPSSRMPTLPPGVDWVCERCFRRNPDERFASVAELARALVPFGSLSDRARMERIDALLAKGAPPPQAGEAAETDPMFPALHRASAPMSAAPATEDDPSFERETEPLYPRLSRTPESVAATDPLFPPRRIDTSRLTPPPPTPVSGRLTPAPPTSDPNYWARISRPTPMPHSVDARMRMTPTPRTPAQPSGRATLEIVEASPRPSRTGLWIALALFAAIALAAAAYLAWLAWVFSDSL